jgi:hypothetical protein
LAEGLCKFYAKAAGKRPIQRQQLLVQYKEQANPLLSLHNHTSANMVFVNAILLRGIKTQTKNHIFIFENYGIDLSLLRSK